MDDDKLIVIVAAAGLGKRLGLGMNKAFVEVGGAPLLAHNLHNINALKALDRVIVVVREEEIQAARELLQKFQAVYYPALKWNVVAGGAERQDSVANALESISEEDGYVAVHDGARPFATAEIFARVWAKARETGAAIAAMPCKDTIKVVDEQDVVVATPERQKLRIVQTPQIFRLRLLRTAYRGLRITGGLVTDDAGAVENMGVPVAVAAGSYQNIKITTPEDLLVAGALLSSKEVKTK